MKGKTLENIVLALGLLVIASAVFLMYIDTDGVVAESVNLIFSIGFIIYIAYSYILSNNLNSEIRGLEINVQNLKEEVGRQKSTIATRDKTIAKQKHELHDLTEKVTATEAELNAKTLLLDDANARILAFEKEAEKEAEKEN